MLMTMKKYILALLLAVSLVLTAAGCDMVEEIKLPTIESDEQTGAAPDEENTDPIDSNWTPPDVGDGAAVLPNLADVVSLVKPSVVSINTEVMTLDFFNRPATQEGAGSGWIISSDGIVVTNNHVIEDAESITVVLEDGRTFDVDLATVARDPLTDLAVLRIDATDLPAMKIGDSSTMRVGDWVVAIGNSLGEGIRATQGIISRQDVSIGLDRAQTLYGLLETDAAINPGNSGGPLVNLAGEVIGITNAKLAAVEVEATGFAISIEAAMTTIQQLIGEGRAIHPWLGVSLYTVDQFVVQEYDLSIDEGVFVVQVVDPSPAYYGGLMSEDVILEFNGAEVKTVDDLIKAIRAAHVGQEVEITYSRNGDRVSTNITLVERP